MIFYFLLLFFVLLIGFLILTKWPKLGIIICILIPIILTPFWYHSISLSPTYSDMSLFTWVKLYTLVLSILLILSTLQSTNRYQSILFKLIYAFFILNIFEAVMKDLLTGDSLYYCNAITGLLLCLTLPAWENIKISSHSIKTLEWNISLNWILAYTLWNITFVYLNYPLATARHITVLLCSLMIACWNNKLWLQARTYTLSIYFFIYFANISFWNKSDHIFTTTVTTSSLVLISLLWGLQIVIFQIVQRRKNLVKEK